MGAEWGDRFSAPCPIVSGHGHRASDEGDALFSFRSGAAPPAARRCFPRCAFIATVEQSVRGMGPSLGACQKPIPMSWALFESIAKRPVNG